MRWELLKVHHLSILGTRLTFLSVSVSLPSGVGHLSWAPLPGTPMAASFLGASWAPPSPQDVSRRAKCPEARNHSCLPGEEHKCRVPLGSHACGLVPGSCQFPAHFREGLTPSQQSISRGERFPTIGGRGEPASMLEVSSGCALGTESGCECRTLLLRSVPELKLLAFAP